MFRWFRNAFRRNGGLRPDEARPVRTIHVDWIGNGLWSSSEWGWRIPDRGNFLFSRDALAAVSVDLLDADCGTKFRDLIRSNIDFYGQWREFAGAHFEQLFSLHFTKGRWNIPWELLLREVDPAMRSRIAITRAVDYRSPFRPRVFDKPLRVLMLKGGSPPSQYLDLAAETSQIISAWQGLERAVQDRVERPAIYDAQLRNLAEVVASTKPHVLWFSGHAVSSSQVELTMSDGETVTSRDFAKALKRSGHVIPYSVFWACDTAVATDSASEPNKLPSLFCDLRDIGVLSTLAMQTKISDRAAIALAQDLFRYLARGLSLERAIARARAAFMESPPVGTMENDWATMVVWSAGQPVHTLEWKCGDDNLVCRQLLGRCLLAVDCASNAELLGNCTHAERSRAKEWLSHDRIWVNCDMAMAEMRHLVVRALHAIQTETRLAIVVIELIAGPESLDDKLKEWSRRILDRLLPDERTDTIVFILDHMRRNPQAGWIELCSQQNVVLVVAEVVPDAEETWFWNGVSNAIAKVLIVSTVAPCAHGVGWSLDKLDSPVDNLEIDAILNRAPRLALAMATLNLFLPGKYLKVPNDGENAACLQDWHEHERIVVSNDAGRCLTAHALRRALERWNEPVLVRQAHEDCVLILREKTSLVNDRIDEQIIIHSQGASNREEAIACASQLMERLLRNGRPADVIRTFRLLRSDRTIANRKMKSIVAAAYLELGTIDLAEFWLGDNPPANKFDRGWYHALKHEIYKSKGDREAARAEIVKALDACNEVIQAIDGDNTPESVNAAQVAEARRRKLIYRHDLARIIHYMDHNLPEAETQYQSIIDEIIASNGDRLLRIIAMRNLGEAQRQQTKTNLSQELNMNKWYEARETLYSAMQLCKEFPAHPVAAEIEYQRYRLYVAKNSSTDAGNCRDNCLRLASQSGYELISAVVRCQEFWRVPPNDYLEWKELKLRWDEIESMLHKFSPNGWGDRLLISCWLDIALLAYNAKQYSETHDYISRSSQMLRSHPGFDRGSDRLRLARRAAAEQLINKAVGHHSDHWQAFMEQYDWAVLWMKEHKLNSPLEVWRRRR